MPQLDTPIAFCIFNRPDVTARVFAEIARQRPRQLYVIGDGPRPDHSNDPQQVAETRKVLNNIDWPCDLRTCFADENLGCGKRMSTGLTWAFEQSEELIILEDDCLPNPSFFGYCETLLQRYRNNPQIMMISGNNFQPIRRSPHTYYFSQWPHIWGWASWRKSWEEYNAVPHPKTDNELRSTLKKVFTASDELERWTAILEDFFAGKIDTWDFLWTYAVWSQQGLTILPSQNLVSNLGFGQNATHTLDAASPLAELRTYDIGPLRHPPQIEIDHIADRWTFENIMQLNGDTTNVTNGMAPKSKKRFRLPVWLRQKSKNTVRTRI